MHWTTDGYGGAGQQPGFGTPPSQSPQRQVPHRESCHGCSTWSTRSHLRCTSVRHRLRLPNDRPSSTRRRGLETADSLRARAGHRSGIREPLPLERFFDAACGRTYFLLVPGRLADLQSLRFHVLGRHSQLISDRPVRPLPFGLLGKALVLRNCSHPLAWLIPTPKRSAPAGTPDWSTNCEHLSEPAVTTERRTP